MELTRKHAAFGIALLILVSVVTVPNIQIPPNDVNDYGIVTVHSLYGSMAAISAGGTLDAQDGLTVMWVPNTQYTGEITCYLYADGVLYEKGVWSLNDVQDQVVHTWEFTLDGIPQGTTEFYCAFGGMYTEDVAWTGSTILFLIENEESSTTTTTETTTTETTTPTTPTIPEPVPTVIDEPLVPTGWIVLAGVLIAVVFFVKRGREQE